MAVCGGFSVGLLGVSWPVLGWGVPWGVTPGGSPGGSPGFHRGTPGGVPGGSLWDALPDPTRPSYQILPEPIRAHQIPPDLTRPFRALPDRTCDVVKRLRSCDGGEGAHLRLPGSQCRKTSTRPQEPIATEHRKVNPKYRIQLIDPTDSPIELSVADNAV